MSIFPDISILMVSDILAIHITKIRANLGVTTTEDSVEVQHFTLSGSSPSVRRTAKYQGAN